METSDKEAPCSAWYVYFVRTRSNSLYCGITTDVERRFSEHCGGKGAKALKGKGQLTLAWSSYVADSRSQASKVEARLKKLSKSRKEAIVSGHLLFTQAIDV